MPKYLLIIIQTNVQDLKDDFVEVKREVNAPVVAVSCFFYYLFLNLYKYIFSTNNTFLPEGVVVRYLLGFHYKQIGYFKSCPSVLKTQSILKVVLYIY